MAYQPYYPGGFQPGQPGGTPVTHEALNHMDTQYREVKVELGAAAGDIAVHGSNLGPGTVDLDKLSSTALAGLWPFAAPPWANITRYQIETDDQGEHKFVDVQGSGVLLGCFAAGGTGSDNTKLRISVDGAPPQTFVALQARTAFSDIQHRFNFLPPARFNTQLTIWLVNEGPPAGFDRWMAIAWVAQPQ